MNLIQELNKETLSNEVAHVQVGDTVRVHVKVKEGSRERIQIFEGTVIAKKHGGIEETITAASLTASAWRRFSPFTLPPSTPARWCATVLCGVRSCTTCVAASARVPRSRRSCKKQIKERRLRLSFFVPCGKKKRFPL